MKLTKEQITEISGLLDLGMICFYHPPTNTIESHPDPDDPYFEEEDWQDTLDKIKGDSSNYSRFNMMDSNQSYQVMQDFTNQISDLPFQARLQTILENSKPFNRFKNEIDNSSFREKWFKHNDLAQISWVEEQIKQF